MNRKKKNYLIILKFSLGIFFSIILLGEGKLILLRRTIIKKINDINMNILISNLLTDPNNPGLVFL